MSATGRGAERKPYDYYATPEWCTEALVHSLRIKPGARILEPCAGDGAIVRVVKDMMPWVSVDTIEIRGECRYHLELLGDNFLCPQDFLTWDCPGTYDYVITNPPYSLAEQFVLKALQCARFVAMLLRINFLGGQKRNSFLRARTPGIKVLSRRPSFTGHGTDATEYAWFVWGQEPIIEILPNDP